MVIAIFGESCTGKSTLAERIAAAFPCDIYTGKDYLRLAKNENIAKATFRKKLAAAVGGENIIYVISEIVYLALLPAGALRILVTADLELIKARFIQRMRGNLPAPVAAMLEKKHGCFDGEAHDLHVVSGETDLDAVVDRIRAGGRNMAIQGIEQPAMIPIDESLRLRKFDGIYDFALEWYQDAETVYLVDGKRDLYTMERLKGMYEYLNDAGELYFIEVLEKGSWKPIGDVTFWQEDMPIVIGDRSYRGRGIGRKVIFALIQRGRELGYVCLAVDEIYHWNESSRRCFESVGFRAYEKTEKGARYRLLLQADK